jgi:hypothetical protein
MGGNPMCNAKAIPNGDPQHKLDANNACPWCTCSKHVRRLGFMEAAGLVVRDGRKGPEKSDIFRSRGDRRSLPFYGFCIWLHQALGKGGATISQRSADEDLIKLWFLLLCLTSQQSLPLTIS